MGLRLKLGILNCQTLKKGGKKVAGTLIWTFQNTCSESVVAFSAQPRLFWCGVFLREGLTLTPDWSQAAHVGFFIIICLLELWHQGKANVSSVRLPPGWQECGCSHSQTVLLQIIFGTENGSLAWLTEKGLADFWTEGVIGMPSFHQGIQIQITNYVLYSTTNNEWGKK